MKTRMFLIAAALMLFSSLSFGQGFTVLIYNDDHPLTYTCGGADFIPDGATVYIHWDNDSNGPDADDPLAQVGNEAGMVNYNQFPFNGEALGFGPGLFLAENDFVSVGALPNPSRFFLAVHCAVGPLWNWNSAVAIFGAGPQAWDVNEWTCSPCGPPPCDPTELAPIFAPYHTNPQMISVCVDLCVGMQTIVRICDPSGAPLPPNRMPVSSWHPGCFTPCDNPNCPPGNGVVAGPIYDPAVGCWVYVITGDAQGCFCFTFERFLAVEGFNNDFVAMSLDKSVGLTWSTGTLVGYDRFEIARNGEKVAEMAVNSNESYEYVDGGLNNGTTYNYTLTLVDANNNVTELGTASSTPSFSNAVVTEYALHQNFPNPFNPSTTIAFDVLEKNLVTLKIYNAAGQEVATVVNGEFDNGRHVVTYDATSLTSGIYFYTVKIGNEFSATKKMLLVK